MITKTFTINMVDLQNTAPVHVAVDTKKTLWVSVGGVCVLRLQNPADIYLDTEVVLRSASED